MSCKYNHTNWIVYILVLSVACFLLKLRPFFSETVWELTFLCRLQSESAFTFSLCPRCWTTNNTWAFQQLSASSSNHDSQMTVFIMHIFSKSRCEFQSFLCLILSTCFTLPYLSNLIFSVTNEYENEEITHCTATWNTANMITWIYITMHTVRTRWSMFCCAGAKVCDCYSIESNSSAVPYVKFISVYLANS